MDTIIIKQTTAGWIVWDTDYEEELAGPYVDRCSAEAAKDNEKSNRAEKAWDRFCDNFYG